MNKNHKGFSYVEILVALGLFALMLGATLPLIFQAGRNMNFSETSYANHLLAQEKLDIVRAAIIQQQSIDAQVASFAYANEIYAFGVWVFGAISHEFIADTMPQLMPQIQITYAGCGAGGATVIVVICDRNGNISGRAVGRVWT